MTLVFYWNPAAPTSGKATLTRGEVKAVFDAARARHLASAAGGDTWWIERKGKQSVVKIPTSDYKLSWVAREIEGLKRGACDNLVRVESVEQVTFSIGKRVVITFEYIDGLVVDEAIRTDRWPSPDDVRELLRGVLTGLAVLHGRETVHRDVKPANLALRDGDWSQPVILDLGLARLLDEKGITKYPVALGTEEFMAPEVIQGARAQKATDLLSTILRLREKTPTQDPCVTPARREPAGGIMRPDAMPNRRLPLLAVALLAVAACTPAAAPSGSGSPEPSASPSSDPDTIDHPTGPTDIVLRYDELGGFVPAEFFITNLPIFTLYGDGTILFRNPQDQPPADENFFLRYAPLKAAKLSEDQIQELIAFAINQGGLGVARNQYDNPMMADVGTAVFTLRAGGNEKTVSIVGLTEGGAEGPDAIARRAFLTLAARLRNFDNDGAYPTVAYEPPAYRAILQEVTGVVARTHPWPWANLTPADFPTSKDPSFAPVFPQRVLTPAEVAEIGLGDLRGGALGIYLDGPDGKQYSLSLRPLLPGEKV